MRLFQARPENILNLQHNIECLKVTTGGPPNLCVTGTFFGYFNHFNPSLPILRGTIAENRAKRFVVEERKKSRPSAEPMIKLTKWLSG